MMQWSERSGWALGIEEVFYDVRYVYFLLRIGFFLFYWEAWLADG